MRRRPLSPGAVCVVGAANGIGAATARRLARAGAALVLADIEPGGVYSLACGIRGAGGRAVAHPTDVRDVAALRRLLEVATDAYGAVSAVINCAAMLRPGDIAETSADDIRLQVDVNLTGTMLVAHVFVPHFLANGGGHLVNVASLGGVAPMPGETAYCATKFGVRGFSQALALELRGTGVIVSSVCPDSTDTRMLRLEAQHAGSAISFASAPLDVDAVARAIIQALVRQRREVLVPGLRGLLVRLLAWFPSVFALCYPLIEWIGRRGQARYRAQLPGPAMRPFPEVST
ncbi:MAG: SDR family oxidoreductase [Gemmatimonadota bacterium]|nr:SDR family oxidoreductase [Gemmatimonadota bacterium]MDH4349952.1 SDR family oxidoreductase [Gemmatimonadota bacterium]MDH5196874.1 SDR family oxidoreductase [Gemmatimonadota bacterium]